MQKPNQYGYVLVTSIIFLLLSSIIAISSMRGSFLQEKMAGNMNSKTLSLMAAEAGATAFHNWLSLQLKNSGWPTTSIQKDAWQTSIKSSNAGAISANNGSNSFFWINPSSVLWNDSTMSVTITSTGHAFNSTADESTLIGKTEFVAKFNAYGGGLLPSVMPAPLTFAGNVSSFAAANSNNFKISGNGSPAIATNINFAGGDNTINDAISRKDRAANYTGENSDGTPCSSPCVKSMDLGSPWGDPAQLKQLIESLIGNPSVKYYDSSTVFSPSAAALSNSTPITIVNGNVTFSGNPSDYTGTLIVLGGTVDVIGGGNLTIYGSIYIANRQVNSDGSWSFGSNGAAVKGGGGLKVNYNPSPGGSGPGGAGATAAISNWAEKI